MCPCFKNALIPYELFCVFMGVVSQSYNWACLKNRFYPSLIMFSAGTLYFMSNTIWFNVCFILKSQRLDITRGRRSVDNMLFIIWAYHINILSLLYKNLNWKKHPWYLTNANILKRAKRLILMKVVSTEQTLTGITYRSNNKSWDDYECSLDFNTAQNHMILSPIQFLSPIQSLSGWLI